MNFLRHLPVPAYVSTQFLSQFSSKFSSKFAATALAGLCSAILVPAVLTQAAITESSMLVSWYGPGFDGGYTANGEVFSRYEHTAAHPSWPFHTLVQLTNPNTGAVVTVRINDRSGGSLDISEQAARDLGTYSAGITAVQVEILQWGN